jgi:hypothetical protein
VKLRADLGQAFRLSRLLALLCDLAPRGNFTGARSPGREFVGGTHASPSASSGAPSGRAFISAE